MNWRDRHPRWLLAVALLVAFLWRLWNVDRTTTIETDGAYYCALARRAVEHGWRGALDPAWPPLFPWLTACVGGFSDSPSTTLAVARAAFLVSACAGTLLLWATWELARDWRGPGLANAAVALLVFHSQAVRYSAAAVTDGLFALLFATAVLVFSRLRTSASTGLACRLAPALAGLLVALATLTRPEGWALALVFGALLLRARALRDLLVFLLPLLLILAPWLAYLHAELGVWSPGAKGPFNFHHAHAETYAARGIVVESGALNSITPVGTLWESGDYRVRELLEAAPIQILARMLTTALGALVDKLPSIVGPPLFLLALYGLWRARAAPWLSLVLALLATTVAFYTPFFVMRRFFLPFLPFLLIASAAGLGRLAERLAPARAQLAVVGLVGLSVLVMLGGALSGEGELEAPLYAEAGPWIRAQLDDPEAAILFGRKPQPAYYADCAFRRHLEDDLDDLRELLTRAGATHYYLDDQGSPEAYARALEWIATGQEPEWLGERAALEHAGGHLLLWRCDLGSDG